MTREICDVIDRILILGYDRLSATFVDGMKKIQRDAPYSPPEHQPEFWIRGANLMYEEFGDDPDRSWGWIDCIISEWMDETNAH